MEADWKRDTLAESHNRKAGRGEVVGGGGLQGRESGEDNEG